MKMELVYRREQATRLMIKVTIARPADKPSRARSQGFRRQRSSATSACIACFQQVKRKLREIACDLGEFGVD